MTTITIRTVGNPGLYRSLQDDIASTTRHRTVSGALRRLEQITRQSARWSQNLGHWGTVEVEIDGCPVNTDDLLALDCNVRDYLHDRQDTWARDRAKRILADLINDPR